MRAHHIHAQGTQNRHSMSLVTNAADDANDQKKILRGNRSRAVQQAVGEIHRNTDAESSSKNQFFFHRHILPSTALITSAFV